MPEYCPAVHRFRHALDLRTRLTLIRLALIRKPWSFGEGVSHPLYRYSYLHLLFHKLHQGSRHGFGADGMLPYRPIRVPRLRQAPYTRLLSMPGTSTSELLRTLQTDGCFQANVLAVFGAGPRRLTQAPFRGLGRRSGFFSSRARTLAPAPSLPPRQARIRSLSGLDRR